MYLTDDEAKQVRQEIEELAGASTPIDGTRPPDENVSAFRREQLTRRFAWELGYND